MHYPKSFPNSEEADFLDLLLCDDERFAGHLARWKSTHEFESLDFSYTRLLPRLYVRIVRADIDVPYRTLLKGVYKATWLTNKRIVHEATSFVRVMNECGIPVMLLKGVPLLLDLYDDVGARAIGDVDVLVPPEHVSAAILFLKERGWKFKEEGEVYARIAHDSVMRAIHREVTMVSPQGVEMDVHWALFEIDEFAPLWTFLCLRPPSLVLQSEFLWKDARPAGIGEEKVLVPCPEDMLIHIILHGSVANKAYRGFRWVLDATLLLRQQEMRWEIFLARTEILRCAYACLVALEYLREMHHFEVPKDVIDELKSRAEKQGGRFRYYRNGKKLRFRPLGNAPLLWYAYWRFAKRPSSRLLSLIQFPSFCMRAWGVSGALDFARFLARKIAARIKG